MYMLRVLSFILLANVITPQWRRGMMVVCQSIDHEFKIMLTPTFFFSNDISVPFALLCLFLYHYFMKEQLITFFLTTTSTHRPIIYHNSTQLSVILIMYAFTYRY